MFYRAVKAAKMLETFKGNFPPVKSDGPLCSYDKKEAPDWDLEGQKGKLNWLFKGLLLVAEIKVP